MESKTVDHLYRQSMLYDFYGQLLTDHQREIYEDYLLNDLGMSEIARERGISRQSVHDLVRRCNGILEDYELKLRLVERFRHAKERVAQIGELARSMDEGQEGQQEGQQPSPAARIARLAQDILNEDF